MHYLSLRLINLRFGPMQGVMTWVTGFENHLKMHPHRARGTVMIYSVVVLTVMLGFAVLAVDLGRISLARSQLQDAADAAARYAVTGMVSSSTSQTTAQSHAVAALADCTIEGVTLSASNLTTTIGVWNSATGVFTATLTSPNAVKIDLTFRFTTGTGRVPLFVQALSSSQQPLIHATAISKASSREDTFSPPASGNLWLSGMPSGTQTKNFRPDANWVWDYAGTTAAPRQSPLALTLSSVGLQAGDSLTFEGLSGTASYVPSSAANSADGDSSFIVALGQTYPGSVPTNNINGISNVRAPIGAVMAVFMNDNAPNLTSAPTALDFNSAAQRDYSSISPQLKQVFFVGNGKKSDGQVQRIVVPTGATRVFIGMMDAWQWNDNTGNFSFKVYGTKVVTTVK